MEPWVQTPGTRFEIGPSRVAATQGCHPERAAAFAASRRAAIQPKLLGPARGPSTHPRNTGPGSLRRKCGWRTVEAPGFSPATRRLRKPWALAPATTIGTGAGSPIRGESIFRRAEARRFHPIFIAMSGRTPINLSG